MRLSRSHKGLVGPDERQRPTPRNLSAKKEWVDSHNSRADTHSTKCEEAVHSAVHVTKSTQAESRARSTQDVSNVSSRVLRRRAAARKCGNGSRRYVRLFQPHPAKDQVTGRNLNVVEIVDLRGQNDLADGTIAGIMGILRILIRFVSMGFRQAMVVVIVRAVSVRRMMVTCRMRMRGGACSMMRMIAGHMQQLRGWQQKKLQTGNSCCESQSNCTHFQGHQGSRFF